MKITTNKSKKYLKETLSSKIIRGLPFLSSISKEYKSTKTGKHYFDMPWGLEEIKCK